MLCDRTVSWAAFYSVNPGGIPFVYDSGTSTTHWLNEFEAEDVKLIPAQEVVAQLISKVREDAAAVLEDEAVNALATIKQHKPASYQRTRNALKQVNKEVSLASVDRSVKARIDEIDTVETHHGYAKSILAELTEDAYRPVGHHGDLYVVNPVTGLWERKPVDALIRLVAERHDAKEHCSRASDFRRAEWRLAADLFLYASFEKFADGQDSVLLGVDFSVESQVVCSHCQAGYTDTNIHLNASLARNLLGCFGVR